jgi:hypothetical protein
VADIEFKRHKKKKVKKKIKKKKQPHAGQLILIFKATGTKYTRTSTLRANDDPKTKGGSEKADGDGSSIQSSVDAAS